MNAYLIFKSIHLIAMVGWIAGLFFLAHLFVIHSNMLSESPSHEESPFVPLISLERMLFRSICLPSMILTWFFGLALLYINGMSWLKENPWMHAKLLLVVLLTAYHHLAPRIMNKLKAGKSPAGKAILQFYRSIPVLFLIATTLLAVYKNLSNFGIIFGGLVCLTLLTFVTIKYRINTPVSE